MFYSVLYPSFVSFCLRSRPFHSADSGQRSPILLYLLDLNILTVLSKRFKLLNLLGIFEINNIRHIYEPRFEADERRNRSNMEIDQIQKGEDLAMHVKSMRLGWLGYIGRMQGGKNAKIYYRSEKERKAQKETDTGREAGYGENGDKSLETDTSR